MTPNDISSAEDAAALAAVTMEQNNNNNNNKEEQKLQQLKRLICIRHARSEGNEFLATPGNQWGEPTFCDDATLIDARLTETGMQQVREELLPKFVRSEQSKAYNDNNDNAPPPPSENENKINYAQLLQEVDLVIVSPLTRTQQTFQYGVLPALEQLYPDKDTDGMPTILAHPWSTERVYTASDTGRKVAELMQEFTWVDWSLLEQAPEKDWWYSHAEETAAANYKEWRPHGEGQWYAVPGEPVEDFQVRMKQLEEWIAARKERTILLVAHWGVLRYLTGGYEADNCEVKILDPWQPLHRQREKESKSPL